ncbi:MAG TPA: NfeD family protein [Longimicrobiales bacterium]|nr:NfeD family protein [Longimicrobiales bacterium]
MFRRRCVVLALLCAVFPALLPAQKVAPGSVYRVPVRGVIELGLAPFIARSINEAEKAGARAVVLEIETPGGRVDAAQQIVNALKEAKVPTYAFINRRAFSAGAMIALATDGVFMRDGAVMGAATPVDGGGTKAPEKIVSAMRSEMRALAEARSLDPRVAEAMVDEEIEIPGVVAKGKLLTLTTAEAVKLGYAQQVADWNGVMLALRSVGAPVQNARVNWAEGLVRFFTHPLVAPMLLSLGFLGLLIEIKTPAFGLAGVSGLVLLGLFFGSHYLVGLAGWEEIMLLFGGLALIGIEMFVLPGFGIAGVAGLLAVIGSIYLSLVTHLSSEADMSQAAGILSAAILAVIIAGWAILRALPRSGRFARSGVLHGDNMDRTAGYISSPIREELVGMTGVALTDLRPAGAGQFGDEKLDVVSDNIWISAGTPIRIVRSEGYRHVVVSSS